MYHDFSRALIDSQRPKGLSAEELEQYNVLLEEQAYPFEEKAIELHEINARRTGNGMYDQWVRQSFTALSRVAAGALCQGREERGGDGCAALGPGLVLGAWRSAPPAASHRRRAARRAPANDGRCRRPGGRSRATSAYDRALTAIKTGKMQEAEVALRGIARREPQLSGAHANLGLVYLRQGRSKEAVEALNRAIELNPRRAELSQPARHGLSPGGPVRRGAAHYQAPWSWTRNYAKAHFNLGYSLRSLSSDAGQALNHYRRYQALDPPATTDGHQVGGGTEAAQRRRSIDSRKEKG